MALETFEARVLILSMSNTSNLKLWGGPHSTLQDAFVEAEPGVALVSQLWCTCEGFMMGPGPSRVGGYSCVRGRDYIGLECARDGEAHHYLIPLILALVLNTGDHIFFLSELCPALSLLAGLDWVVVGVTERH